MIPSLSSVSVRSYKTTGFAHGAERFGAKRQSSDTGIGELDALIQKTLKNNRNNPENLDRILLGMTEKIAHTRHMIELKKIPTCLRQAHSLVPNMAHETVSAETINQFVNKMAKAFAKTDDIIKQKTYLQAASLAVLRYAQKQAQFNLYDEALMPIVHSQFVSAFKPLTQPLKAPWPWQNDKLQWHNRVAELPDYATQKPFEVNEPHNSKEWANLALATWKQVLTQAGPQKAATFLRDFDVNKCLKEGVLLICEEPKKWTKYEN